MSRYVALVSGLELGGGGGDGDLLSLELLTDLLCGQLGDEGEQQASANVVRLIVAGNSLSQNTHNKDSMRMVSCS